MIKQKIFLTISLLIIGINGAYAASFDCAKARRPLEKFICSTPELDSADEQMGNAFKEANATFPLKGFVLNTQKRFLIDYPTCMLNNSGKTVATPETARACLKMVQLRTNELRQLGQSKVYSNAQGKFSQEDLAILVYQNEGRNLIKFWGNWMPDAYQPAPFPEGWVCDINANLTPTKGGFKTDQTDDTVISITDGAVKLSGFISCSPRTGIAEGIYKRFK